MEANLLNASRILRGAAKLRDASSSVARVASGYERSLPPGLACFSRPHSVRVAEEAR